MAATTNRPGAMGLLDKYAQINSSIEDARRRVAEVRSNLDSANDKIHNLREERDGTLVEIETAKSETSQLESDLKEVKATHRSKLADKDRVEREHRLAKSEYDGVRSMIDDERNSFLERCREFRASCKRMRVAASILVLDGGGNFDAKDASDDVDLWRRLQEEDFSDDEEDYGDGGERTNKRKHKKVDDEADLAEKEERESRQAAIEAECALQAERVKNADAIKRSNARTHRLTQQRAQLQRHRKEVEELEREILEIKDDVVQKNQLANTFEKEFHKRKQLRTNASFNGNASYANNFNPPEESRSSGNSNRYRTPQTSVSYQQRPRVTNPYTQKTSRAPSAPTPPRRRGQQNGRANSNNPPTYASDMLYGVTPGSQVGRTNQRQQTTTTQQHPHRGGHVRNQRQFGTSVGVSLGVGMTDDGMTDELRECFSSTIPTSTSNKSTKADADDMSDVSTASSDDEELLSFNIFGKK